MASLATTQNKLVDSPSNVKRPGLSVAIPQINNENCPDNKPRSNKAVEKVKATPSKAVILSPETGILFQNLTPKKSDTGNSNSKLTLISSTLKKHICASTWDKYLADGNMDWIEARSKELEYLISKFDIPRKFRSRIWMKWSGGEELKGEKDAGYFKSLQSQLPKEKVRKQIELDLPRTCPKHEYFNGDKSLGREQLRQILYAYAQRNPKLGYLQSMNFIAAHLILVTGDVETSFWILTGIVEQMLGDGFYLAGLGDLLKNIDTFTELVARKLPAVAKKLDSVGLNISFRVPNWFLCMYFNSFDERTTTRVWDMIFFHASSTSAALSCIGLALVQHAGDAILNAKSAPECAQALQSMFYENASPEKVIENAFYRDWNIDEIKRSLSSQSIRAAVNKKRKCITAPHTSRKHKRSRSEGDNFFVNKNISAANAPYKTAIKRRRTNLNPASSRDDSTLLASTVYSPFVAFKKWLTPSKKKNENSNKKSGIMSFSSPKPGMTFHAHKIRAVESVVSKDSGSPMGMEMKSVGCVKRSSNLSLK